MNKQLYKTPYQMKSSRLRSVMGLLMVAVYALGQFVFASSAMIKIAELTGQHQILISGDCVVLHHSNGQASPHHGLTKFLVALSHRNATGDHILPFVQADLFEEPRCGEGLQDDPPTELVTDHGGFYGHHSLLAMCGRLEGVTVTQRNAFITQFTLSHWRTVKRMV